MGWTVRAAVALVVCGMATACAPKAGSPASAGGEFTLDGSWWLLDGVDGPVRARMVFDEGDMKLFPAGTRDESPGWSIIKHRGTWEAKGPNNALLWMIRRGDGELVAWTADGRMGLMHRWAPLPSGVAGRWLVRDPRWASIQSWTIVPGPEGQPGRLLEADGETRELWPIQRSEREWSVVVRSASGNAELLHLARGPQDTWFLWDEPGQYSLMYRKGERPSWLPVQGVLGNARPTRPPPGTPEGEVPEAARDLDVPESMVRSTFEKFRSQLDNMAESKAREAVAQALDAALGGAITGEGVYAEFDLLERRFERPVARRHPDR